MAKKKAKKSAGGKTKPFKGFISAVAAIAVAVVTGAAESGIVIT